MSIISDRAKAQELMAQLELLFMDRKWDAVDDILREVDPLTHSVWELIGALRCSSRCRIFLKEWQPLIERVLCHDPEKYKPLLRGLI